MQVRDVMTQNPSCCLIGETIEEPIAIMRSRDIGFVPVLDVRTGREVIGVVTDRDVLLRVLAKGRAGYKTLVADCMTGHPVCCDETDSVEYAAQRMEESQVRRLPVLDSKGQLCGVISIGDLVRHDALKAGQLRDLLSAVSAHSSIAVRTPEMMMAR
jgi:CBS domain-containing protein